MWSDVVPHVSWMEVTPVWRDGTEPRDSLELTVLAVIIIKWWMESLVPSRQEQKTDTLLLLLHQRNGSIVTGNNFILHGLHHIVDEPYPVEMRRSPRQALVMWRQNEINNVPSPAASSANSVNMPNSLYWSGLLSKWLFNTFIIIINVLLMRTNLLYKRKDDQIVSVQQLITLFW